MLNELISRLRQPRGLPCLAATGPMRTEVCAPVTQADGWRHGLHEWLSAGWPNSSHGSQHGERQMPDATPLAWTAQRHPLPGFGLPEERLARVAARRAFVDLKTSFMRATADIEGSMGELLQRKVRHTREAVELWRLRSAVFAALPTHNESSLLHKLELHQQLDSVFPQSGEETGFVPL